MISCSQILLRRLARPLRACAASSAAQPPVIMLDEDVERIARLSMLNLTRSSPGFQEVKRNLQSALGLLQTVRASSPAGTPDVDVPSVADAHARVAGLRFGDVVDVAPSSAVLEHANAVNGAYIKAPET